MNQLLENDDFCLLASPEDPPTTLLPEQEPESAQQLTFSFPVEQDCLPLWENHVQRRLVAYLQKSVQKNRTARLRDLVFYALKAIRKRDPSKRTVERWMQWVQSIRPKLSKFVCFTVRKGRSFVVLVKAIPTKKPKFSHRHSFTRPFFKGSPTELSCTTRERVARFKRLAFAVIHGYRGQFSRYAQSEDWITLKDLHWENCKVRFEARLIFKAVFTALKNGRDKAQIIAKYDQLLRHHHGLATDQNATWKPTGLKKELEFWANRTNTNCSWASLAAGHILRMYPLHSQTGEILSPS